MQGYAIAQYNATRLFTIIEWSWHCCWK